MNYFLPAIPENKHPLQKSHSSLECQQECLTTFLKTYLDFVYFLCLCPFRVKLRANHNFVEGKQYIVVTWLPQLLLCLTFWLTGVLYMIMSLINIVLLLPTDRKNPSLYFHMFLNFDINLAALLLCKLFWLSKSEIVNLLNGIISSKHLRPLIFCHWKRVCPIRVIAFAIGLLHAANAVAQISNSPYASGVDLIGVSHVTKHWQRTIMTENETFSTAHWVATTAFKTVEPVGFILWFVFCLSFMAKNESCCVERNIMIFSGFYL